MSAANPFVTSCAQHSQGKPAPDLSRTLDPQMPDTPASSAVLVRDQPALQAICSWLQDPNPLHVEPETSCCQRRGRRRFRNNSRQQLAGANLEAPRPPPSPAKAFLEPQLPQKADRCQAGRRQDSKQSGGAGRDRDPDNAELLARLLGRNS